VHDILPNRIVQELYLKGVIHKVNGKFVLNPSLAWDISYGFEHVAIKQQKNKNTSRLHVNISSEVIKGVNRPIPMMAANMSTVCDSSFCIALWNSGALGILHRAAPEDHLFSETTLIAEKCDDVAVSVGVGESQIALADALILRGANIVVIDIAHGYSDTVLSTGRSIKDRHPDVKIVVGNTTNTGLLLEAKDFASAVKIGIAQGAACETKNTAGCTEKQFSAVLKFKSIAKELGIPIISDGGIREPADMVKAIGAGANSIMAGSIFARCPESAAEEVHIEGRLKKLYAGMASRHVQNKWKGGLKDGTCPEGKVTYLDLGESLERLLTRYSGALKSGITYGGGEDVSSFQEVVEFVKLA
jgi:IMP dehydrogenase/GMP reductase